ncbi:MAG: 1-deoxy-D-xylulose-5-phosphate synthase [Christensenellaceae bacterium]|jgi:1-deoxy-D-xylulose-5-phosphate synthase|nr:1-deoxy-D-xylulose-5-phosphate synthase [Christensenellaceae bacterium]
MPGLSELTGPRDLRRLNMAQLNALAAEMRAEITKTCLERGGHLSSNLGVVELSIALHLVYDAPRDKILFDVGHQSYAHKLLTGRFGGFASLRTEGGLSGFPLRSESEYDAFGAGHAGTAVAAALGFARAARIRGETLHCAALVGDGSFMNGPNIEAVNDLGQSKLPVVVVLNDNEMSISKNVGGLSRYLARLRTRPSYQHLKKKTKRLLDRIPILGGWIERFLLFWKGIARYVFVNGAFFSSLGFDYLGPVDGYDLPGLIAALNSAREMERPVLLHVVTKKGKGYRPAEEQPEAYHGIPPKGAEKPISYPNTAGLALAELGRQDPSIAVLTAAMPGGTGAEAFAAAFPDRFFDVGLAEESAVTQGAALAAAGLRPYFMVYSTFLQRGYDQILHDVALQGLPLTLLISHAGLVGEDGCTHNGNFDLSFLLHVPGLWVFSPSGPEELKTLLFWARKSIPGAPVAIRYAKGAIDGDFPAVTPMEEVTWPRLREGQDCTLLAVGELCREALQAAKLLQAEGIEAAVVNARQLAPLPMEALRLLAKAPLITLEENVLEGGFGSSVLLALSREGAETRTLCLGIGNGFVAHAPRRRQIELCGLDSASVARRVLGFLGKAPEGR